MALKMRAIKLCWSCNNPAFVPFPFESNCAICFKYSSGNHPSSVQYGSVPIQTSNSRRCRGSSLSGKCKPHLCALLGSFLATFLCSRAGIPSIIARVGHSLHSHTLITGVRSPAASLLASRAFYARSAGLAAPEHSLRASAGQRSRGVSASRLIPIRRYASQFCLGADRRKFCCGVERSDATAALASKKSRSVAAYFFGTAS